ncbi:hypothetical protein MPSEU_000003800 [Mayamaea pseudoterrestris]|nr:hypothetical protein MPSEU_000003800 [Mayamaea pseudoterrestris]
MLSLQQIDYDQEAVFVDIIIWNVPKTHGIVWSSALGLQSRQTYFAWCCTTQAVSQGTCQGGDQLGRLVLNITDETFMDARLLTVPVNGTAAMDNGLVNVDASGVYMLFMANCNEAGQVVQVHGNVYVRSKHGYLPGELWHYMELFVIMFVIYGVLFIWYGKLMRLHDKPTVSIETCILLAIVLGLVHVACGALYLVTWNASGRDHSLLLTVSNFINGAKQAWARTLVLLLSLGWGVTRQSLGGSLRWIVKLGTLYTALVLIRNMTFIYFFTSAASYDKGFKLVFAVVLWQTLIIAVDFIYVVWILRSISATIKALGNTHRASQTRLFSSLRWLFILALLSTLVIAKHFGIEAVFLFDGKVSWLFESVGTLQCLIFIAGIAYLWRPVATLETEYDRVPKPVDAEILGEEGFELPEAASSFQNERRV